MSQQQQSSSPKQHKSFRLSGASIEHLKEIAALFNSSEAVMLERMIEEFYPRRVELFNEEVQNRLKKTGND